MLDLECEQASSQEEPDFKALCENHMVEKFEVHTTTFKKSVSKNPVFLPNDEVGKSPR